MTTFDPDPYVDEHERLREDVAALAINAIDPLDKAHLEVHLGQCEECTHLLAEYRVTAARMAQDLKPVRPPAPLRGEVLAWAEAQQAGRAVQRPVVAAPVPRTETPRPDAPDIAPLTAASGMRLPIGWIVAGLVAILAIVGAVTSLQSQQGQPSAGSPQPTTQVRQTTPTPAGTQAGNLQQAATSVATPLPSTATPAGTRTPTNTPTPATATSTPLATATVAVTATQPPSTAVVQQAIPATTTVIASVVATPTVAPAQIGAAAVSTPIVLSGEPTAANGVTTLPTAIATATIACVSPRPSFFTAPPPPGTPICATPTSTAP